MTQSSLPLFSVIVPTRSRPQQLHTCLQALACQKYPSDQFEVIVVDDGGELPLEGVVEPFRAVFPLTLVHQDNAGPARARNTGAENARGHFLAFTDDDCVPDTGWLRSLAARCAERPDAAIGGRTLNGLPDNIYSAASQMILDRAYSYHNRDPEHAQFFGAANFAVAASRFHAIGGFDRAWPVGASEDRDLCDRWLSKGFPMIYAPEAIVTHFHALTFRRFWNQQKGYGAGAFHFHRTRQQHGSAAPVPDPRFYASLLRLPFRHATGWRAIQMLGLVFAWQVVNVIGYAQEARRWRGTHHLGEAHQRHT